MKKIALLLLVTVVAFGCKKDDDGVDPTPQNVSVDFKFSQNWDGEEIVNADYETTSYITANGTSLKLSKLVYLISDITFTAADGTIYNAEDYNLVDARTGANTTFTSGIEIPEGTYNVSYTFGFDNEDNDKIGGYPDLNTADGTWSVPAPLGGGYHYMRMEGTFINTSSNVETFQYHMVRANKHSTMPPGPGTLIELVDTSFSVNLGSITIGEQTTIEAKMNVAEWFKNPNTWDLNVDATVMMPRFDLQIKMNENGKNGLFSL